LRRNENAAGDTPASSQDWRSHMFRFVLSAFAIARILATAVLEAVMDRLADRY
jgi:hypothetical protein